MSDQPATSSSEPSELEAGAAPEPVPPPPPRLRLVDVLSADVTPQVEAAARQLIAGGDALLVKNSRTAVHGFVLDQNHFDTRIEWTPHELNAICSCETRAGGFVCPHLWATVLLADRSGAFRPLEETRNHPIFSRNNGEREVGRKSPNAWPARAGWKIHLASIAQSSGRRAEDMAAFAPGLPRQAVYVVDAVETRAASHGIPEEGPAVIVELQSRHLKKKGLRSAGGAGGAWTKPAAFRLEANEIETFTESEDREILARIAGARPEVAAPADAMAAQSKHCALRGTMGIDL
ncbi:MAG TPA: hypothetical protein VHM90_21985, partial [Phycisphaerae bacterium]|nr:hypothetical protein [Phycisphaerae bacterium]